MFSDEKWYCFLLKIGMTSKRCSVTKKAFNGPSTFNHIDTGGLTLPAGSDPRHQTVFFDDDVSTIQCHSNHRHCLLEFATVSLSAAIEGISGLPVVVRVLPL